MRLGWNVALGFTLVLASCFGARPAAADISNIDVGLIPGSGSAADPAELLQLDSLTVQLKFTTGPDEVATSATSRFELAEDFVETTLTFIETTAPGDTRRSWECEGLFPLDTFLVFRPGAGTVFLEATSLNEVTLVTDSILVPVAARIIIPDITTLQKVIERMSGVDLITGDGAARVLTRLLRKLGMAQIALDRGVPSATARMLGEFRDEVRRGQRIGVIDGEAAEKLRADAVNLITQIFPRGQR